jgi:hypothetical protein
VGDDDVTARIVVRLVDVDTDGRSTFVTSGIAAGVRLDEPVRVELAPTAYHVRAGHRLRVVLGDADFPRLWTAPGASFSVRKVELAAPLTHADGDLRAAAVSPLILPLGRRWSISRELLRDDIEVVVGETATAQTTDGHVVELNGSVCATVDRDARTEMEALHDATVRTPSGSVVDVYVSATITETTLRVSACVTVDGHVALDRTWEA